jgi:membrane AbrB-like protein
VPQSRPVQNPSWRRWAALIALTCLAGLLAGAAGIPSPALFGALLSGLAWALLARVRLKPGRTWLLAAQAVIGAAIGTYFRPETLTAVGGLWIAVLLVVLGTLAASLLAGVVLSRVTELDRPTAVIGSLAGGASGIVAMSDELGADARLVAVMQYLRVFVVVLLAPLVVAVFIPHGGPAGEVAAESASGLASAAFTVGVCAAGLLIARVVVVPAGSLLLPLAISAGASATGLAGDAVVPAAAQALAFGVIGLEVGLRFTRETVRAAGRLLPFLLVSIAGVIAICAGLAGVLAGLTHVTFLDAYLATTPGGMYAVLATAVGSSADATFVLAVQALRLLAMLAAAPLLARRLVGGRRAAERT